MSSNAEEEEERRRKEEKKKKDEEVRATIKACRQKHTDACHYLAIEKSKGYISSKYSVDDNIERISKWQDEQETKVNDLKERINGIVSLLGINEVPELGDDHDQLINADNEHLNQSENRQPMGGRRTRGILRARSRRKKGGQVKPIDLAKVKKELRDEFNLKYMNINSKFDDLNNSIDDIRDRIGRGGRRKKRTRKRRKSRRRKRRRRKR